MSPIEQFRQLVTAWCAATGDNYGGLSARMFSRDGSRLGRVMAGADLTSTSLWNAMLWLATNWPDAALWPAEVPWPQGVKRPSTKREVA